MFPRSQRDQRKPAGRGSEINTSNKEILLQDLSEFLGLTFPRVFPSLCSSFIHYTSKEEESSFSSSSSCACVCPSYRRERERESIYIHCILRLVTPVASFRLQQQTRRRKKKKILAIS